MPKVDFTEVVETVRYLHHATRDWPRASRAALFADLGDARQCMLVTDRDGNVTALVDNETLDIMRAHGLGFMEQE